MPELLHSSGNFYFIFLEIEDFRVRGAGIGGGSRHAHILIPGPKRGHHRIEDGVEDRPGYFLVPVRLDVGVDGGFEIAIIGHPFLLEI